MRRRRLALAASIALIAGLSTWEIALRYAGFDSYPLYDIDDGIKYIPSANQHGKFLNKNSWFFNDRHMGNTENWTAQKHPNVLLIGNSIVLGGNPFNHSDKLGPLLEKGLGRGYAVWSVAAGGWSNVNEMVYLDRNPDVLQNADAVIFEFMAGGFSAPNQWPGYYVFPDSKPWFLTTYAFGKYILPRHALAFGSLPPTGPDNESQLRRFNALVAKVTQTKKAIIFLYPSLQDMQNQASWRKAIAPMISLCAETQAKCIDIANETAWIETAYRSDAVHPTVEGNRILASVLAAALN